MKNGKHKLDRSEFYFYLFWVGIVAFIIKETRIGALLVGCTLGWALGDLIWSLSEKLIDKIRQKKAEKYIFPTVERKHIEFSDDELKPVNPMQVESDKDE